MTVDNVSKEMLQITLTKANLKEVAKIATLSEGDLLMQKLKQLTDDGNNGGSNADVSIVLEEERSPNKYGKIVVSRDRSSIKPKEDDKDQPKLPSTTSDHYQKEEMVRNIIDYILSRCGHGYKWSRGGDSLKQASTHVSKSLANNETETLTRSLTATSDREHKKRNIEKNRIRRLSSVVNRLELPISLSKRGSYLEGRPRLERLIDTHITTSATIIGKPEARNHSRPSTKINDEINPEPLKIDSPFDLCWCFGFNSEVPIINLSNDDCSQVVFANSQYAVIYDFHEDNMSFLQGHLNTVSSVSSDSTGNLVATADSSSDAGTSRVIVWNRRSCVLQVLDDVHPYGCQQVALSPRGDLLITVSANEIPTSIKVWEWERDSREPSASFIAKESLGNVKRLTTHPTSNIYFALTFARSVIFAQVIWQTVFQDSAEEDRVKEQIKDCEYSICTVSVSKVGSLTDTTYVEGTDTVALSSTCQGYVVVWENNINAKHTKVYKKYVQLHQDCITSIQTIDDRIVVATVSGSVSFYDLNLKILFSHKFFSEQLVSISFNLNQQLNVTTCRKHPSCANTWREELRKLEDATLRGEPFFIRHFVVSTEGGRMAYVNASCGTPKYLPFPSREDFTTIDISPDGKYLCAGTESGKCVLFDTNQRKVKVTQEIRDHLNICQAISVLNYSPSGYPLACGTHLGNIWLLDPLLLTPIFKSPLTDCNCRITHIVFTFDSEYLIVADASFCISVFSLGEQPLLIKQCIAHYKSIVAMSAEITEPGDKEIKISTLSSDRSICQFLLDRDKQSLEFILNQKVEQTAVPLYCLKYPSPYSFAGTYLGVNSEYKFRLHDNPSFNPTKGRAYRRCRGTLQAPDFGSPINYMETFESDSQWYLFFQTSKHIGIHTLPIDGNPFRALGFKASPTNITRSKVTPDGKYVFTISESCSGISMWKINTRAVEDFYRSGGDGLQPFLEMLEEEKENQIREFFDLGQFLHQGERPNLVRTLKDSLPICEMANVLQALGCLLTKYEIYELTNEVLTSDLENHNFNIEYDDFVRLYLNYRKHKELDIKQLRKAFRDFHAGVYNAPSTSTDADPVFESSSFIEKLLTTGEEMTLAELYADLSMLTGGQHDPPEEAYLVFQTPPTMPKEITFKTFIKHILGFPVDDSIFNELAV